MLTDFNCNILNIDRHRAISACAPSAASLNENLIRDIELLGSLGFHKLIYQIHFDSNKDILFYIKKKAKSIEQEIKKISSRQLSAKFSFHSVIVTYLTEETPFLKDLNSLIVPKTNYIFLELPFGNFPDKLFVTINKLLYTKNLLPVFTNFHVFCSLYDAITIEKLINIKK